jgi:nitrogen fixation/metabolism regulation signal transduction histidine kinase
MTTAGAGMVYQGRVRQGVNARARSRRRLSRLAVPLIVLAVCLSVFISRLAVISSGADEIEQLMNAIAEEQRTSQQLNIQLSARQDPARVRDEATGRLGMSFPGEDRIYVVTSQDDAVIVCDSRSVGTN